MVVVEDDDMAVGVDLECGWWWLWLGRRNALGSTFEIERCVR